MDRSRRQCQQLNPILPGLFFSVSEPGGGEGKGGKGVKGANCPPIDLEKY